MKYRYFEELKRFVNAESVLEMDYLGNKNEKCKSNTIIFQSSGEPLIGYRAMPLSVIREIDKHINEKFPNSNVTTYTNHLEEFINTQMQNGVITNDNLLNVFSERKQMLYFAFHISRMAQDGKESVLADFAKSLKKIISDSFIAAHLVRIIDKSSLTETISLEKEAFLMRLNFSTTNRALKQDTEVLAGIDTKDLIDELIPLDFSLYSTRIRTVSGSAGGTSQGDLASPEDPEKSGKLFIGDIGFIIPPTSMHFSWVNQASVIPTIRTEGDAVLTHNNHIPRVTITLYFNGENAINTELRPLIAMFKYMPFSTVQNTTIFDAWVSRKDLMQNDPDTPIERFLPISCYLENISFSTIPGFPNSIQATLSITSINKMPHSLSNRLYKTWKDAEEAAKDEAILHSQSSKIISAKPGEDASEIKVFDSNYTLHTVKKGNAANKEAGIVHEVPGANAPSVTLYPSESDPFKDIYKYKLQEVPYKGTTQKNIDTDGTFFWQTYNPAHNKSLFLTYKAPKKFDTEYTIFADRLEELNEVASRIQAMYLFLERNPGLTELEGDHTIFEDYDLTSLLDSYIMYIKNMYSTKNIEEVANNIWTKIIAEIIDTNSPGTEGYIQVEGEVITIGGHTLEEDFKLWDPNTSSISNNLEFALNAVFGKIGQDGITTENVGAIDSFITPFLNVINTSEQFTKDADISSPLNYNSVAIQLEWDNTLDPKRIIRGALEGLINSNTHSTIDGNVVEYHAQSVIDSISYSFANNGTPYFLNSSNLPVYQHMGIPSASASVILRTRDERLHKLIGDMATSTQEIGTQLMKGNYKLAEHGTVLLTGNLQGPESGVKSGHILNCVGFNFASVRNASSRSIEGHPGWWEISVDFVENTQNLRLYERLHAVLGTSGDLPINISYVKDKFFPSHATMAADGLRLVTRRTLGVGSYYGVSTLSETKILEFDKTIMQEGENVIFIMPSYSSSAEDTDVAEITFVLNGISDSEVRKQKTEFLKSSIGPVLEEVHKSLTSISAWEGDDRDEHSITGIYASYCKDFLYQLVYTLRDMQTSAYKSTRRLLTPSDIDFSFATTTKKKIIDFTKNNFYLQSLFLDNLIMGFTYTLIRHKDFRKYLDHITTLAPTQIEKQKLDKLEEGLTHFNEKLTLFTDGKAPQSAIKEVAEKIESFKIAIEEQQAVIHASLYFMKPEWSKLLEQINKSVGSNFPDLFLPQEYLEDTGLRYISPYLPFVHDDVYLDIIEMHKSLSDIKLNVIFGMAALRSADFRTRYFEALGVLNKKTNQPDESNEPPQFNQDAYFDSWDENKPLSEELIGVLKKYGIDVSHKMSAFVDSPGDKNPTFKKLHQFAYRFSEEFDAYGKTLDEEKQDRPYSSEISKIKLMKLMASVAIMEFLITLVSAKLHTTDAINLMNKRETIKTEIDTLEKELREHKEKAKELREDEKPAHQRETENKQTKIDKKYDKLAKTMRNIISSTSKIILGSPEKLAQTYSSVIQIPYNNKNIEMQDILRIEEDSFEHSQTNEAFMQAVIDKLNLAKSMNSLAQTGNWAAFTEFFGVGTLESEKAKAELLVHFETNLQNKRSTTMAKAFPTFKLFFVEEDNNNWHAFDDFYSYDAISEISIVESKHAASKTAIIKLSNITGNLTTAEYEGLFSEKDSWGSIPQQAMRIKTGAEIMILVGYGADYRHLRMKFKGAVTEIRPGPIMEITAQSWGAGLLNKVGSEATTTYTSLSGAHSLGSAVIDILSQTPGIGKLGGWTIRPSDQNDPTKTSATTFKNIYYARILNSLTAWAGNILPLQSNFKDILGGGFLIGEAQGLPFSTQEAVRQYRNDNSIVSLIGNTLFDNIMINTTATSSYGFWNFLDNTIGAAKDLANLKFSSVGFQWHVVRQSAWSSLHEIALFLGDYIVTTLPFDEGSDLFSKAPRETLYFGPREGFYKNTSRVPKVNTSWFMEKHKDKLDKADTLVTFIKTKGNLDSQNTGTSMLLPKEPVHPDIVNLINLKKGDKGGGETNLEIFTEILDIGKRLLSNSLHKENQTIPEYSVFNTYSTFAYAERNKLYLNFRENLLNNNFTYTLANVNSIVTSDLNDTPYVPDQGPQSLQGFGEAVSVGGTVAGLIYLAETGAALLSWPVALIIGVGTVIWYAADELNDLVAMDGLTERVTSEMSINVIHEILLNDFERKYYPNRYKKGYQYTSEDRSILAKLRNATLDQTDFLKYNERGSALYKRHKDENSSALKYIIAPAGVTSIPSNYSPVSYAMPSDGYSLFNFFFENYFQKQDIMIFLDTVEFLHNYYKTKKETNTVYNTNPKMYDLDEVFLDIYGEGANGVNRLMEGPVVNQHAVSSYEDIIDNGIIATADQMYNHVELLYPSEPDPANNPNNARNRAFAYYSYDQDPDFLRSYQSYQKNLDPNIFLDKSAADSYVDLKHLETEIKDNITSATALEPHRVANQILMNVMRPMYQGTLTILGNPNIKPWDVVHIHDDTTQMYGPIEVEQVVTTLSPSGYSTTLIPNALVYHNHVGAAIDRSALNLLAEVQSLSTLATSIKWAIAGGLTLGAKSYALRKLNKAHGASALLDKALESVDRKTRSIINTAGASASTGGAAVDIFHDIMEKHKKTLKNVMSADDFVELNKAINNRVINKEALLARIDNVGKSGGPITGAEKRIAIADDAIEALEVLAEDYADTPAGKRAALTVEINNEKLKIEDLESDKNEAKTTKDKKNIQKKIDKATKTKKTLETQKGKIKGAGHAGIPHKAKVKVLRQGTVEYNDLLDERKRLQSEKKMTTDGRRRRPINAKIKTNGSNLAKTQKLLDAELGDSAKLINDEKLGKAAVKKGKLISAEKERLMKILRGRLAGGPNLLKFGMKAANWIFNLMLLYDVTSFAWDYYETLAKSSILQANLLAGSNALTILPLEYPAGKDYTAGLEGIIGTSGVSNSVRLGFSSNLSTNRSIRVQDIILQNMELG